jgi:hypothetical protein
MYRFNVHFHYLLRAFNMQQSETGQTKLIWLLKGQPQELIARQPHNVFVMSTHSIESKSIHSNE